MKLEGTKVLLVEVLRDVPLYKMAFPGLTDDCEVFSLGNWPKLEGLRIQRAFVAAPVSFMGGVPGTAAERAIDCIRRSLVMMSPTAQPDADIIILSMPSGYYDAHRRLD